MAADVPVSATPSDPRVLRLLRGGAFVACAVSALLGLLGLLGWTLDLAILRQASVSQAGIKLNSALCLLLAGLALAAQLRGSRGRAGWAARLCAAGVAVLALLTLLEYLAGWDLGIDELLVVDYGGQIFPGRMPLTTALGFALLGLALLMHGRPRAYLLACCAVAIVMVGAWVVLIGYIYGVASLYKIVPYERIAPQTALALVLLGFGVLVSWPANGVIRLLARRSAAGLITRRLLPAALLLPLGLGWLRWQGQLAGYYETAFGLSLFVAMNTLVFAALIWWSAGAIEQLDLARQQIAEALQASQQRFQATFAQAAVGLAHVSMQGRWLEVNQKLCDIVGYTRGELLARTFQEMTYPADLVDDLAQVDRMLSGELSSYSMEKRYIHKLGQLIWVNLTVSLVRSAAGEPAYFVSVIEEITERKRAEAKLRESEQRFFKAFHANSAALAITRLSDGVILDVNERYEQLFGYARDELVGHSALERGIYRSAEQRAAIVSQLQAGQPVRDIDLTLGTRSGELCEVLFTVELMQINAQTCTLAILYDITERRRIEQALKRSEERFAKAFRASPAAVTLTHLYDGRYLDMNDSYLRMLGYTRDELIGRTVLDMNVYVDATDRLQMVNQVLEHGRMPAQELPLRAKSGEVITVLMSTEALELDGQPSLLTTMFDITDRKRAEAALRASEELLRTVTETAQVGLAIVGPDHRYRYANQTYKQFMRLPPDDMAGISVQAIFGPAYERVLRPRIELAFRGERVVGAVQPPGPADPASQEVRHYEARLEPGADLHGPMVAVVLLDVTERERALAALRASEALFAKAFRASPAAVTLTRLSDGTFLDANDSYVRLLGYARDELIGQSALALNMYAHAEQRDTIMRYVAQHGGMHEYEVLLRAKSGVLLTVLVSTEELELGGQPCLLTTMFDITERKRAELELQNERYRLRTLIDNLPDLIFLKDTECRFIVANRATAHFMGAESPEQLLGKTDYDFYPHEHAVGYYSEEQLVMRSGTSIVGWEKRQEDVRGNRVWLSTIKVPLYDAQGQIAGLAGIERDISERKRAEEAVHQLNAELEQRVVQRTAELEAANRELEAFSYSVSHDLRAPLRAIAGFSRILFEEYAAGMPGEVCEYLQLIRDNAQHMDQLIGDLLAFARLSRQPLRRQPVDLGALVRETLADLQRDDAGHAAELVIGELASVSADPALLRQVLVNLLANALKFSAKRERPRIEVDMQTSPDQPDAPVFFVRDNGAGFDMRYAGKLFGVFQRLHRAEEYEGTGVGLAIVQRVIHRHGGRVWAEAAVDQGATFFFTLGGTATNE